MKAKKTKITTESIITSTDLFRNTESILLSTEREEKEKPENHSMLVRETKPDVFTITFRFNNQRKEVNISREFLQQCESDLFLASLVLKLRINNCDTTVLKELLIEAIAKIK